MENKANNLCQKRKRIPRRGLILIEAHQNKLTKLCRSDIDLSRLCGQEYDYGLIKKNSLTPVTFSTYYLF